MSFLETSYTLISFSLLFRYSNISRIVKDVDVSRSPDGPNHRFVPSRGGLPTNVYDGLGCDGVIALTTNPFLRFHVSQSHLPVLS